MKQSSYCVAPKNDICQKDFGIQLSMHEVSRLRLKYQTSFCSSYSYRASCWWNTQAGEVDAESKILANFLPSGKIFSPAIFPFPIKNSVSCLLFCGLWIVCVGWVLVNLLIMWSLPPLVKMEGCDKSDFNTY